MAKKSLAAGAEKKAVATDDLDMTSKDLAGHEKAIGGPHQDCTTKTQDCEAATKTQGATNWQHSQGREKLSQEQHVLRHPSRGLHAWS